VTALNTPGAVRRAIREKIKAILVGQTPALNSVFISRSLPTEADALPAIGIYTTGETVERFNEAPKDYRRELSLMIEVNIAGDTDDDLDQKREDFADKIESLIEKDETLGGLVDSLWLTANEFAENSEGESPIGKLSVLYTVRFYMDAARPAEDLTEFQGADVDWKIKRPEELPTSVDASDEVNLETP
jgi:hypothetical protein